MQYLKFKVIIHNHDQKIEKSKNIDVQYYDNETLNDVFFKIIMQIYGEDDHFVYFEGLSKILWDKYFPKLYKLCDENLDEKYYKYSINKLKEQFNFGERRYRIVIDPPIGGDVGYNLGIHYFFHTKEKDNHHEPHIHVRQGETEFRVNLITLMPIDAKTFKNPKKTKQALKVIKKNKDALINYWNTVVINGESIKFKMYFKKT